MRRTVPRLVVLASLAGCSGPYAHVAPSDTLTAAPHEAAALARFETLHVPGAGDRTRAAWRDLFLQQPLNRAFAVGPHRYGAAYGVGTAAHAAEQALAGCNNAPNAACTLYAVNTEIVYPGAEYTLPFRGRALGPFRPSPEFTYRGPEAARGLVVWSHGTSAGAGNGCGSAGAQFAPPGVINRFNADGWDVVRYDRDPCRDDLSTALRDMPGGIAAAHRAGYARIVLAGQSRGAVQSLELLRDKALAGEVAGVLAFSPASSGQDVQAITIGLQRWSALVGALSGPTPVAVFFFSGDDYNPMAKQEADYAAAAWRQRLPNARVVFDADPAMAGHGGATRPAFTRRYAGCLVRMMDASAADACAQP